MGELAKNVEFLGQEIEGTKVFEHILGTRIACGVHPQRGRELSHLKGRRPHDSLKTMSCVSATSSHHGHIVHDQRATPLEITGLWSCFAITITLRSARTCHLRAGFMSTMRSYLACDRQTKVRR